MHTGFFTTATRRAAAAWRAAWARFSSYLRNLLANGLVISAMMGTIYLPIVSQGSPIIPRDKLYGLALNSIYGSDLRLIGVKWFYTWGTVNPLPYARAEFVPMLWHGIPHETLPATYSGVILVGNEPDNPYQLNITPQEMAERFQTTRQHYPNARLLCCGTLSYNAKWVKDFIAAGGQPDGWHLHAYIEGAYDADDIIAQLEAVHAITGGTAWITEYSALSGDVQQFAKLTEWLEQQAWIERIAPYTNRQPGSGEWWEINGNVDLVSPAGALTGMGQWYANRITSK